ncbi:MAG: YihY/virulence factor BrkB family protein [Lachnospiraceae bacterium]
MKPILRIYFTIREISKKISNDHVSAYAAQSSFYIIVCIFPLIIFLFTILQYTPITEEILLKLFLNMTPDLLNPMISSMINEVYTRSSIALISITAIATLWVAGKIFIGISQGLNTIYGVTEKRNYLIRRILCTFYTLIFITLLVAMLLFLVFGNFILHLLEGSFPLISIFAYELMKRKMLIAQCLLTLFFMFIYKYVPNRKSSLIRELPGALFAGIGWQLFSYLYSFYINYSTGFTAMYGSLATIVFAMLWLYFCFCIFFFGAEINTLIDQQIILLPKFGKKKTRT